MRPLLLLPLLACADKPATPDGEDVGGDSAADTSSPDDSGLSDDDGDGYGPGDDCDDGDAAINPGADEICDGVDNDCDGETDEGAALTVYPDADGDGYGDPAAPQGACEVETGFVEDSSDCDDGDAAVNPGAGEVCDGDDDDCDDAIDEDPELLGSAAQCPAAGCQEILAARPAAGDGVYWIEVLGSPAQLTCDQTADGGGWTLVASFLWPGDTAGISGWTGGGRVGATTHDASLAFKLSDDEINALAADGYRARGIATHCNQGPCVVDITLFWKAACTYQSGASSVGACAEAYRDPAFADPTGWSEPCSWHYGLTSVACGGVTEMGTSHEGDHIFVGMEDAAPHAYDGRLGEDPSLWIWVR